MGEPVSTVFLKRLDGRRGEAARNRFKALM
jgi:hypothetical protein